MGKEPDMEAMAEFYPDEEEETNDPVNDNVTANVRVNGTVNDPINENVTANVRVNDPINKNVTVNVRVNDLVNENVRANVRVNDSINAQLISFISANPYVSAMKLAEHFNKSERHIRRILSTLQSEGAIRRIGADKNGHWEVIDNQSTK